jgi:hypothetical protein
VNYEDIKNQIIEKIESFSDFKTISQNYENDYELRIKTNLEYKDKIWFYSSDYSDIL